MSFPFPGASVPAVTPATGNLTNPWLLYLQPGPPGPIVPVVLGPSPATFTASAAGSLAISGGTVSARTLTRSGVTVPIGASMIPMANNDVATITYSVAPTASFIPAG
jgi:hypothetical protein